MDVYVGVRWQCVEYARRYLIIIQDVSFQSIDSAFEIFNLTSVKDLTQNDGNFSFSSYENGNANPPMTGDLIIFPKAKDAPFGHVAVVANVNLLEGYVELAEQNYFNELWENPKAYARRVIIKSCENKYVLINSAWRSSESTNSNSNSCLDKQTVIGWKRVIKIRK